MFDCRHFRVRIKLYIIELHPDIRSFLLTTFLCGVSLNRFVSTCLVLMEVSKIPLV